MTLVLSSGQPECSDLPEHTSQTVLLNTLWACLLMFGFTWVGMRGVKKKQQRSKTRNINYRKESFLFPSALNRGEKSVWHHSCVSLELYEKHQFLEQSARMSNSVSKSTEKQVSKHHG